MILIPRPMRYRFTLHAPNLGLKECLQLLEFGRESLSPLIEFEVQRRRKT